MFSLQGFYPMWWLQEVRTTQVSHYLDFYTALDMGRTIPIKVRLFDCAAIAFVTRKTHCHCVGVTSGHNLPLFDMDQNGRRVGTSDPISNVFWVLPDVGPEVAYAFSTGSPAG